MLKDLKEDRSFGVVVYNNFVIRIDSGDKFNPHTAVVRIWINKNNHSAGFKISEQDLIAIIQTVSVTKYLRQLDISLGGDKNGVLPLEKVAMALTQAINKVAPDAHTAFTAQKINRR